MSTIVLRGATSNMMDDLERAIDDAVNVVKAVVREPRLVPGAGATEIELALRIGSIGQVRWCCGEADARFRRDIGIAAEINSVRVGAVAIVVWGAGSHRRPRASSNTHTKSTPSPSRSSR